MRPLQVRRRAISFVLIFAGLTDSNVHHRRRVIPSACDDLVRAWVKWPTVRWQKARPIDAQIDRGRKRIDANLEQLAIDRTIGVDDESLAIERIGNVRRVFARRVRVG